MTTYDKSSIKKLNPIEHIRKRPGVYIPDIGQQGLLHLFREIFDNSIDEYLAGHGNKIDVNITRSDKCDIVIIRDYGRGIPVGFSKELNIDTLTAVMTLTLTGGKFDDNSYKTSTGQNGIGIKAVNALSTYLKVKTYHDKLIYMQDFRMGIPITSVYTSDNVHNQSGTEIEFSPDNTIFEVDRYDIDEIKFMLLSVASIIPGLTINFKYITDSSWDLFTYDESDVLSKIHNNKMFDYDKIFCFQLLTDPIYVRLSYHKTSSHVCNSFINTIHTYDGGSHVQAVYTCLSDALSKLIGRPIYPKQITEGLNLSISLFHKEPCYRGQHKSQVSDSTVYKAVYSSIYNTLYSAISKDPDFVKYVSTVLKKKEEILAEVEIKKTISKIKADVRSNRLPIKLSIAFNCTPVERELFIVEGDSAAGSTRTARNPKFQEILPIKGKIINSFKSSMVDLLASKEVTDIFLSLSAMENSGSNPRVHNVFIMNDSDPDGSHISSLLMSLFMVLYPSFISKYNLYLVNTPLFTLHSGNIRMYGASVPKLVKKFQAKHKGDYKIYRNKGLGEMSSSELKEFIDPKTRSIVKITTNSDSYNNMNQLMGIFGNIRKEILENIGGDDEEES